LLPERNVAVANCSLLSVLANKPLPPHEWQVHQKRGEECKTGLLKPLLLILGVAQPEVRPLLLSESESFSFISSSSKSEGSGPMPPSRTRSYEGPELLPPKSLPRPLVTALDLRLLPLPGEKPAFLSSELRLSRPQSRNAATRRMTRNNRKPGNLREELDVKSLSCQSTSSSLRSFGKEAGLPPANWKSLGRLGPGTLLPKPTASALSSVLGTSDFDIIDLIHGLEGIQKTLLFCSINYSLCAIMTTFCTFETNSWYTNAITSATFSSDALLVGVEIIGLILVSHFENFVSSVPVFGNADEMIDVKVDCRDVYAGYVLDRHSGNLPVPRRYVSLPAASPDLLLLVSRYLVLDRVTVDLAHTQQLQIFGVFLSFCGIWREGDLSRSASHVQETVCIVVLAMEVHFGGIGVEGAEDDLNVRADIVKDLGSEEKDGSVLDLVIGNALEGVVDELLEMVGTDEFWLLSEGRDSCLIFSVHFFFVSNCGRLLRSRSEPSFLARWGLSHRIFCDKKQHEEKAYICPFKIGREWQDRTRQAWLQFCCLSGAPSTNCRSVARSDAFSLASPQTFVSLFSQVRPPLALTTSLPLTADDASNNFWRLS
ncbi:putative nucleoside diphosphatase, partial [Aureobasidium melanogenum]